MSGLAACAHGLQLVCASAQWVVHVCTTSAVRKYNIFPTSTGVHMTTMTMMTDGLKLARWR